jgi:hypothetical protein
MIVSHKHKFIFIKTRKTAGTSIEIALSQYCGFEDVITKISKEDELIRESLGYLGPQNFKTQTPYLNIKYWLSMLKIAKYHSSNGQHASSSFIKKYIGENIWNDYFKFCIERNPFDRAISHYYWDTRKLGSPPEINEYLQTLPRSKLSNWSFYTIQDQIAVDYVGRYETLDEGLRIISRRLGLPDLLLLNAKSYTRKSRQHYSQILNEESRRHIEKMCANEIEKFNYYWVNKEITS